MGPARPFDRTTLTQGSHKKARSPDHRISTHNWNMPVEVLKSPLEDMGPCKGHIRPYWNMDVGRFMLAFLLSLVWGCRTQRFQLIIHYLPYTFYTIYAI